MFYVYREEINEKKKESARKEKRKETTKSNKKKGASIMIYVNKPFSQESR